MPPKKASATGAAAL
jgi:hypothetical protein